MNTQFITNDKGQKTGVIVSIDDYKRLMAIVEEFSDIKAYDEAIKRIKDGHEEIISIDEVLKSLKN